MKPCISDLWANCTDSI